LLRGAQIRINERTIALCAGGEPGVQDARVERLSARQRRLAELAHRMNERR